MYPVFNVQRTTVSGLLATNLGGSQSAFQVPGGATGPNSPPLAAVAIDAGSPFLPANAQHAALLSTLQAAAAAAANTSPAASLPFSASSSPTVNTAAVTILPLASPHHHQHHQSQQFSPSDRSNKAGGGASPNTSDGTGQCTICSDRATGKHYGANSCDGCKGFFRRTVRKNQVYVCRFSRTCVIDKDKRNTCRFCRFRKCLQAGMRREAVQNERDRISFKRAKSSTPVDSLGQTMTKTESADTISILLQAEGVASQLRASVITSTASNSSSLQEQTPQSSDSHQPQPRLATIGDLSESIKQQLLLLVEWAKVLPPFYDLPLDDQVALLRAYAAQHLLLGVARRSLPYRDVLLLSNDACIPRSHASELHDVNHVVLRLLEELVEPMRDIQLDDTEYVCLKALLFFNPNAYGLSTKAQAKKTRQHILEALQSYVNQKLALDDKVRFGNILLLLPPLQAMSQQFIEDLQLATLFGMARFDKLLEELLLAAAEPLSAPFLVDGISAVANKMAGGLMNLVNGNGTSDADSHVDEHNDHIDVADADDQLYHRIKTDTASVFDSNDRG